MASHPLHAIHNCHNWRAARNCMQRPVARKAGPVIFCCRSRCHCDGCSASGIAWDLPTLQRCSTVRCTVACDVECEIHRSIYPGLNLAAECSLPCPFHLHLYHACSGHATATRSQHYLYAPPFLDGVSARGQQDRECRLCCISGSLITSSRLTLNYCRGSAHTASTANRVSLSRWD
jgi:hypothetical protein